MNITWHSEFARSWLDRIELGRMPHAVLLAGPAGVGKRAAAAWIASQRLGIGAQFDMPQYPAEPLAHPDLHWLEPLEDKKTIGVDQVRGLVDKMGLTSYKGSGKVAIIEPANAMTVNAANSLLKTLEEPPGDALLILVADRAGKLPATIFSRCQRIDFAVPAVTEGLEWPVIGVPANDFGIPEGTHVAALIADFGGFSWDTETGVLSANVIPTPGAMALLALGGLSKRRRRN